jgi:hypothetical protein
LFPTKPEACYFIVSSSYLPAEKAGRENTKGYLCSKVAMQFALPPRKSSHQPSYVRSPRIPLLWRRQLRTVGLIAFAILIIFYILPPLFSSSVSHRSASSRKISVPVKTPKFVLVTLLDRENLSHDYLEKIQRNREVYASKHGMYPVECFGFLWEICMYLGYWN